ncbi:MAG: response regulator [Dehalococcoidia bacterium]
MTGIEACRQIRADTTIEQPTIIIMLTAMGQDSDLKAGIEAGADEYFVKPFSPISLLQRVYEAAGLAA